MRKSLWLFSLLLIPVILVNFSIAEQDPGVVMDAAATTPSEAVVSSASSSTITMDLKGVDILDVLKILSKRTGLNIVAGKNVSGTVTLFLQEVNVWAALKRILETIDLAYIEEDGIIRVMTDKDYEQAFGKPFHDYRQTRSFTFKHAKATEVSEIVNQVKSNIGKVIVDERTNTIVLFDIPQVLDDVAETIKEMDLSTNTHVFHLKYAAAEDLEPKLKTIVNPVAGSLEIDKRSNKIYVRDLPDKIHQVQAIIDEFDSQPQQVLIDAKVIEVVLDDQNRFGINWNAIVERNKKAPYSFNAPLTVTNPTNGPLSNITFATLTGDATLSAAAGTDDNFNFVINALEGVGKTNTLSSPRITVLNNQEAKLAVATREPFISQTVVQGDNTATTADNVQFVDVGVTLTVKPTITADNHVMIKVKPAVSTSGTPLELQGVAAGSNTQFVRTRVPVVTTQEVETTVIVKSGTTIVMGGLIQDRSAKSYRKIPVLGDLPAIGAAFRNKIEDDRKTELVVFLTPRILKPDKTTSETGRFINKNGELLDFDQVADVNFVDSYRESNHAFQRKTRPYWQDSIRRRIKKRSPYDEHPLVWDSLDASYIPETTPAVANDKTMAAKTDWISVDPSMLKKDEVEIPVTPAAAETPKTKSVKKKTARPAMPTALSQPVDLSEKMMVRSEAVQKAVSGESRPPVDEPKKGKILIRRKPSPEASQNTLRKKSMETDLSKYFFAEDEDEIYPPFTAWFEKEKYAGPRMFQPAQPRAAAPLKKKIEAANPAVKKVFVAKPVAKPVKSEVKPAAKKAVQPAAVKKEVPVQKISPAPVKKQGPAVKVDKPAQKPVEVPKKVYVKPEVASKDNYSSFVPEEQSASIYQEIQKNVGTGTFQVTWRAFFDTLKKEISTTLKKNPTLSQMHGEVKLEFVIDQSGKIRDLQVLDTRQIRGPGQKLLIAEVLSKRRSFTPLPKELGDSKKIHLTVRL